VLLALILLPVVAILMFDQSASFSWNLRLLSEPGFLGLTTFLLGANVSLAVFNMLPAFPMDGGRVFRAFLGFFTSYHRATQIAVIVGRIFAFGLGYLAIINNQYMVAIIALFIFVVGGQEGMAVAARNKLRQVQVGQVLGRNPVSLPPYATVGQASAVVMSSYQANFPVLDPVSEELLGVTTSRSVARAMTHGQWHHRIFDIMEPVDNVPVVAIDSGLDEVQEKLMQNSSRVAAVYDGLNFQGLISLEDIQRAFQFLPRRGPSPQRTT
jgi:CBS domain-containing protein